MEAETVITEIVEGEGFWSFTHFPETSVLERKEITTGRIILDDGRMISASQRNHIHATLDDIAKATGYEPGECKLVMKYAYLNKTGFEDFSLSDCDMTKAKLFLQFLIDFCLEQNIPTKNPLIERDEDTARYIYACLANKKCCVTQKEAHLHHVDAVGMGNDRDEIIHEGYRVLPLEPEMHAIAHNMGRVSFEEKYHVFGIKLDRYLCKIWGVRPEPRP